MSQAERRKRGAIHTPRAHARRRLALQRTNGTAQQRPTPEIDPPVPPSTGNAVAERGWRADPALAARVEETLATLTLKRRRFLLNYLENGNIRHAVMSAGYNCKSPQTASDVGNQIMADPYVQHAYQALLEARGLSGAKLDSIHAVHLSRHSSVDSGDRDRSLRALALVHKYGSATAALRAPAGAPPTGGRDGHGLADQLLDQMSATELKTFAETGRWPTRFRHYLVATQAPDALPAPDLPVLALPPDAPSPSPSPTEGIAPPSPDRVARENVHGGGRPMRGDRAVGGEPPSTHGAHAVAVPAYESCREEIARQEHELRRATHEPVDPAWREMALRDRRW
jgi:hypothetical protein